MKREVEIYLAKDNERLDSIVYKHYGDLNNFNEVLILNSSLNPILKAGDRVVLPKIENKNIETKERALW